MRAYARTCVTDVSQSVPKGNTEKGTQNATRKFVLFFFINVEKRFEKAIFTLHYCLEDIILLGFLKRFWSIAVRTDKKSISRRRNVTRCPLVEILSNASMLEPTVRTVASGAWKIPATSRRTSIASEECP